MIDSTFLACSRIRVHVVPGRTDGILAGLHASARILAGRSGTFSYAELCLIADGNETILYWLGDEQPDLMGVIDALPSARELEIRFNLCSDEDCFTDVHGTLTGRLADGSLADSVHLCTLMRSGDEASLFLSGLHGSGFHHGPIAFGDGLDGIPGDMCWNSLTHTARFTFPEAARDDAWDLSDLIQERIEEIDLEFSYDDGTLSVHSVQLPGAEAVEGYRSALAQLAGIAASAEITGTFSPEAENAFALLRFVLSDGCVTVQTAAAEI